MSQAIHQRLEIYGTAVWVCYDEEGWEKIRKRVAVEPELGPWKDQDGHASTYDIGIDGQQHIVLRFNVQPGDALPIGIVAHEAFHAAMSVCSHVGINVYAHADEAAAYLAQWFAEFAWHHRPAFNHPSA